MIAQIPINLLRFLVLLLAQVLIFSNINFSPLLNVFVFPLFILLLPFETPRWLLMVIGMLAGLSLDLFFPSTGMHAAAGLLLGYLRPFLINIITPKGTEFEISPNIHAQGLSWFLIYTGIAMFIYLLFYFIVEAGTLGGFFWLLVKTIISLVTSEVFILIFLYLFSARKTRRFA